MAKAAVPLLLVFFIGGCPKRQAVPRVVYVQPPPAATASAAPNQESRTGAPSKATAGSNQAKAAAGSTEALVIEEPPPPPPAKPAIAPESPPATPPAAAPRRRVRPREDVHQAEEQAEPADSAAPASPAEVEVPSLEPQSDAGNQEGLQSQLQTQEDEIKRRIDELHKNAGLSTTERRTLKDATSFWSQAAAALQQHDLLRARELAEKASLLVTALEHR